MDVRTATRVLGIRPGHLDDEGVRVAWRRFAREHHPDRCPGDAGAARRFAAGREAVEALRAHVAAPVGGQAPVHRGAGIVRGEAAGRAVPYAMPPLAGRQWAA
jgi:hypothetical protein